MTEHQPGPAAVTVGVPRHYRLPDVGPVRLFDDAVRDFGELPAVVTTEAEFTWRELAEVVDRAAVRLADLGVRPGIVVALTARGRVEDVVAPLAVWRAGGALAVEGIGGMRPDGAHLHLGTEAVGPAASFEVTRRGRRGLRRRDGGWQITIEGAPIPALPTVGTDVAIVTTDEAGERLEIAGHVAVAAAFAVRLWIPDVQAGEERILLTGLGHHDVVGTLLPGLLAAMTFVPSGADPVTESLARDCTVLHVVGNQLQAPSRTDTGRPLRVVLHHGPTAPGVADEIRRRTGARVAACAGPAVANFLTHAQAVYGPVVAAPGHAVTNTRVAERGDAVVVSGPQIVGGTTTLT